MTIHTKAPQRTDMEVSKVKEMMKDWHKQLHTEFSGWDEDHENFERWLRTILTEAHQAGYEEAVEVVKEVKTSRKIPWQALRLGGGCPDCGAEVNQSFVDNEFKEAVDQALDDTIKALQDKK